MASMRVPARVANGVRWLDENFPNWDERIDLETLRLWSGFDCICGQVFREAADKLDVDGGFQYAKTHLFAQANSWISEIVPKNDPERARNVGYALGFISKGRDQISAYDGLQKEWERVLRKRELGRV